MWLLAQESSVEYLQGFVIFCPWYFPDTHKKSFCWLLGCDNLLYAMQVPNIVQSGVCFLPSECPKEKRETDYDTM
jgi:hypothetical protein